MTTQQQRKTALLKEYNKHISEMIETEHIANTIRDGMDTDISVHDVVISTRHYDAGVFVIDPIYKRKERQQTYRDEHGVKHTRYWEEDGEEMPNPYVEMVRDSDEGSRLKLSVKCNGGFGSREERRIKVRKLCLMSWDSEKNEYPRQSLPIIFREKTISFAESYGGDLRYFQSILNRGEEFGEYMNPDRLQEVRRMIRILEGLVAIPPFSCFYDEKYGFLIKREIRMRQVVFSTTAFGLGSKKGTGWGAEQKILGDALNKIEEGAKEKEKNFTEHVEKRPIEFAEELVAVAMNPDRIDSIVEKYGVDAVEKTFGAE